MKFPLPLLLLGLLGLSGCSRYQIASIQSKLPTTQVSSFVEESDSLKITYSFGGPHCPVQLQVENKLANPLFIDWRRSSIIVNNQAYSYYRDNYNFTAVTNGMELNGRVLSINSSTTEGNLDRMTDVAFIPPKASMDFSGLSLKDRFFELPKGKRVKTKRPDGTLLVVIQHTFDEQNSPMKFRSYLTLSYTKDFSVLRTYDHQFWVDQIHDTLNPPGQLDQKENEFYVRKTSGFGKFLGGVAVVALLVGALAANQ